VTKAEVWQNEAKIINVFKGHAGQLRGALTAAQRRRPLRTVLLVTAVTAAMFLDPVVSLRRALVRGDGDRRWHHTDGLQHAKPGHVPQGGECQQPRLLLSEPRAGV
jgi:hypothetical protein